jgi:4-hydroxy-2-oxoheptanedioate aldolase
MLMLGPADYSVLTGIPGELNHPTIADATQKVARAAKNSGKHWAATCGTLEQAKRYIDMGARLVFHNCDLVILKNGLEQLRQDAFSQAGLCIGGQRFEKPRSYLGR